ncbi:hypothetical protein X777_12320 [Ooceraea biroi]|uniref:Uncharacterized protein n=1 Tax=Ooceraea biroi TaxID=2015173 RepID=A0A026W062_OOCBI|nr:hypothetical protein X777_12320 [Ooceraea biroi]
MAKKYASRKLTNGKKEREEYFLDKEEVSFSTMSKLDPSPFISRTRGILNPLRKRILAALKC